ncbi:MAG: hypothetical protein RI932_2229, partial [Pseudomonadota bacterium]
MYNIRPKYRITRVAIRLMAVAGVYSLTACGLLGEQAAPRNPTIDELRSTNSIKRLSVAKPGLETLYASTLKGQDSAMRKEIDNTMLAIVGRSMSNAEKAELAYESLRNIKLLVRLPGSSQRALKAVGNVRQTSVIFGADLMRTIYDTFSEQSSSLFFSLNAVSELTSQQIAEKLEQAFDVFSNVAAGVENTSQQNSGKENALESAKKIESTLKTLPKPLVTTLIESLKEIVADVEAAQPANAPKTVVAAKALTVAVSVVNLGEVLSDGLNKKLITEKDVSDSVREWRTNVTAAISKASPEAVLNAEVITPPPLPTIDPITGAYSGSLADWEFVIVTAPTMGTLNAKENPPRYTPGANFTNDDVYSFRLCHKTFTKICSVEVSKKISLPVLNVPPSIIPGTDGNTAAQCIVTPNEKRTVIYSWYQKSGNAEPVLLPSETARDLPNRAYASSIKVFCQIRVLDEYGLSSASLASELIPIANNSPSLTVVGQTLVEPLEDQQTTIQLGTASDVDGDQIIFEIRQRPTKGNLSVPGGYGASPLAQTITYTPIYDLNGADFFTYRMCDNVTPQACSDEIRVNVNLQPQNDQPA